MQFSWADFFIAFFIVNSIPHLLVARMDIRYLSGFGFGAGRNIAYSVWNIMLAGGIAIWAYGWSGVLKTEHFWRS